MAAPAPTPLRRESPSTRAFRDLVDSQPEGERPASPTSSLKYDLRGPFHESCLELHTALAADPLLANRDALIQSLWTKAQKMLDEIKQFLHPAAPLSPVREPAVSIDAKHPREQSLQLTPQHLVHELRQPLNIIVGSLQELRGQIDTAQSIQSLKHGYVLMGNIFTNMAQGGIVKLQKKPFTLRQLVDEIKDFQKLDSNVQITIDDASIREHLDISLYGDPGKLQQILLNLVSNAAKFCVDEDAVKRSGKDKPTVEISFECQQDDDDKLLILMSVKDYGPGIPKEARDKLFKPGSRLEQPKNAKDKSSSGIGLNVSHLLVQCMQQDGNLASRGIECESVHSGSPEAEDLTRPTWTKFSFSVPIEKFPEVQWVVPLRTSDAKKVSVLFADDTGVIRKLFGRAVEQYQGEADLKAALVCNGSQAEIVYRTFNKQFQIIILDMSMPNPRDGWRTANKIRQIAEEMRITPPRIVFCTGGSKEEMQELGIQVYHIKPVSYRELLPDLLQQAIASPASAAAPSSLLPQP